MARIPHGQQVSSPAGPFDLATTCLRLRGDASIEPLHMDAGFWEALSSGRLGDFHHQYLLSLHRFESDWPQWEMHPRGEEVVCLLGGRVTFVLDLAQGREEIHLDSGGTCLVVPRGAWHTARTREASTLLFVTAGEDTRHRPVED